MTAPLAVGRTCGACRACCRTHEVTAIAKPAGEWCPDSTRDQGCSVYATRPEACRSFACAWLMGQFDQRDRPDRSGVVLSRDKATGRVFAHEAWQGGLETERARFLVAQLALPPTVVRL